MSWNGPTVDGEGKYLRIALIRKRYGDDGKDLKVSGDDKYQRIVIKGMDYDEPSAINQRFYVDGDRLYNRIVVKNEEIDK